LPMGKNSRYMRRGEAVGPGAGGFFWWFPSMTVPEGGG